MSEFDLKRAAFKLFAWLVAAVVGTHLFVVLMCVAFCFYFGEEIVEGKYQCDPKGRCLGVLKAPFDFLGELLKP